MTAPNGRDQAADILSSHAALVHAARLAKALVQRTDGHEPLDVDGASKLALAVLGLTVYATAFGMGVPR